MMTNRRNLLRAEQRRHARTAARLAGCVCEPDMRYTASDHLEVQHDSWCPAVTAASQLVVYVPQSCDR